MTAANVARTESKKLETLNTVGFSFCLCQGTQTRCSVKHPLSLKIVRKAEAAMISAVEVYNRPSFAYREETFAILAINAWELLLKGKVLKDNGNKARSIWDYRPKKLKSGKWSKPRPHKNRSDNHYTISIFTAMDRVAVLDPNVRQNLESLIEIRDNSVHYFTAGKELSETTSAISVATVKNFVLVAKAWFNLDLSSSFSLCLPLAFIGYKELQSVTTGGEKKLVKYLAGVAAQNAPGDYAVAFTVGVKLQKTFDPNAAKIVWSNDPDAIKVTLTEAEFNARYPLTYKACTAACRAKIPGFLKNKRYNDICDLLESNPGLSGVKSLDPQNPKAAKQRYYSPNMVTEIGKQWALQPAPPAPAPVIVPVA